MKSEWWSLSDRLAMTLPPDVPPSHTRLAVRIALEQARAERLPLTTAVLAGMVQRIIAERLGHPSEAQPTQRGPRPTTQD
jgi:hypothetical protein